AMQEILGVLLHDDVDRIEQPLKVAFLDERCTEIRHNEIAYKQNSLVRQFDEHCVRRLSPLYGSQTNARSAHVHLHGMIDEDIRLEAAHVIHLEALAEEMPSEIARRIEFFRQFFLIIVSGIEVHFRIQRTKVCVTANVVPVSVREEDSCQF